MSSVTQCLLYIIQKLHLKYDQYDELNQTSTVPALVAMPMWMGKYHKAPSLKEKLQEVNDY